MPQTSPMNWILFSNLIAFFLILNSVIFSYFQMNFYSKKSNIIFSSKVWSW